MAKHSFPKTIKCAQCNGTGFVAGCTQTWVVCPGCLGVGRLDEEGAQVPDAVAVPLLRASLNEIHRRLVACREAYRAYQARFPDPLAGDPYKNSGEYKGD